MKFASLAAVAAAAALTFAPPTFAQTTLEPLTYNPVYSEGSLLVGCANGGTTGPFRDLASVPSFPNVGAFSALNWDYCGTCYLVTYGNTSIYITVVNFASDGWEVSVEAMNTLTGGLALELGKIEVISTEVDASFCGISIGPITSE